MERYYLNISLVIFLLLTLSNILVGQDFGKESKQVAGANSPTQTDVNQLQTNLMMNDYTPPEVGSLEWEEYWRRVRDAILSGEVSVNKWKSDLSKYFSQAPYTLAHQQVWDAIFQEQKEYSNDLVLYSMIFHTIALLEEVKKPSPIPDAILLTSRRLFQSLEFVKESHRSQMLSLIDDYLKKSPLIIDELWRRLVQTVSDSGEGVGLPLLQISPVLYESVAYLCLSFDAYLPQKDFTKYIVLPERMLSFYRDTGILLFEGGALSDMHYRSLVSILSSFPPSLHQIRAIIVPEAFGGVSASRLWIPPNYGVIIDIPFIPIEVMSNPDEFPFRIGKQVAPEFSLQTVVQIIRAIQWVQFRLRPELAIRRERVLLSINPRGYNYVRQTVHPSIFFSAPDELLPQAGYVWCLNTDKALQMANDLLRVRQHFATDVFMLLADLLSEGRNLTLTFFMDEEGILNVREAPVIRIPIDEGFPAVVGISPERFIPEPYLNLRREMTIPKQQSIYEDKQITSNPTSFSSGLRPPEIIEPQPISGE